MKSLRYWDSAYNSQLLPRTRQCRYVTFDLDQGGLNNIRLVLEYVTVIAAITGRTLVLPPAQPWYLINYGPIAGGAPGGYTGLEDMFNLSALREAIPVLTTQEFIAEAHAHLGIPDQFQHEVFAGGDEAANSRSRNDWREWLLNNTQVVPWNPYDKLICLPDIVSVAETAELTDDYIDGRQFVEFSPAMLSAPVIHFPSNDEYRSLGPVATMLVAKDQNLLVACRGLLKHHVRFCPEIFAKAGEFIALLGQNNYDAIHVRRNDFQYEETQLNANTILENIEPLLNPERPLYIATDETDGAFFEAISRRYEVIRWLDLLKSAGDNIDVPFGWIGPIEQIICAGAHRFIGTDLSTFSAYINRIRGYVEAHDMDCYYHSVNYSDTDSVRRSRKILGREYLRENPLFWTEC